ncbi:MAG: diacylglycerol kinase family lipid kinase [Ruminococcaceae bacterium]|nr:diacylglycerol kinase family lipid kinase [Oscillospiraceae bacterium]
MKYVFIINPTAGKGKLQAPFVESVKEYFNKSGGEYEIFYTSKQGEAMEYSKKLAQSGEELRIYACGGEGTAYEVLNGIYGYDNVTLGVVPCGSANDYISYYSDKELFLDVPALIDGDELEVDLIKMGDKYALNSCSIGMDAMVASHMSKFKKWPFVSGKMAYVLALIYTFFSKMGVNLKIKIDDGEKIIEQKSLFAVVANAPYYGGGFYPTPKAEPFDGILDYSVISVVKRLKILSLLDDYRAGTHVGLDICKIGTCQKLEVVADREVPINMDGEITYSNKATFEIVKKGIKLVLPKTISSVWREKSGQVEATV